MHDEHHDQPATPPETLFDTTEPTTTDAPEAAGESRFAAAGRLGAERVHQLIGLGRQFERDHGLTRGRQRQRQLIALGKRYEQEHGLAAPAPRPRRSKDQVWADFVAALARVVKPAYRADAERLVAALAARSAAPAGDDLPEDHPAAA